MKTFENLNNLKINDVLHSTSAKTDKTDSYAAGIQTYTNLYFQFCISIVSQS